jgi:hypothetical protein
MRYSITVNFDTDRELTLDELNTLRDCVALQIEEPVDLAGNGMEFRTNTINVA